MDLSSALHVYSRLRDRLRAAVKGRDDVIELVLVSLLSDGHVLLEDYPGSGKTTLAKGLGDCIIDDRPDDDIVTFRRIQFTPDLLPADITGTRVLEDDERGGRRFVFHRGPVFANVLLADEINRATPRTQSALLECMGESQVTVDGRTYALPSTFFVIATQNPIESQGTFPLPEAQLDRFLMRISVGYPARAEEVSIVFMQQHDHPINTLTQVLGEADVASMRAAVKDIFVDRAIGEYIVDIVGATRAHPSLVAGSSPRGSLALTRASQAAAFVRGDSYVRPHLVKRLAPYVLSHRVMLHPQVRISGASAERVIAEILNKVPVPTQAR